MVTHISDDVGEVGRVVVMVTHISDDVGELGEWW